MAYATLVDMTARYGAAEMIRLTAPEGDLDGPVDADAVAVALADATSLVDSFVAQRHDVPLATVPASITAATCALARHALALARAQAPAKTVVEARDEALAWLGKVATGDALLFRDATARVQDRERMSWPGTAGAH